MAINVRAQSCTDPSGHDRAGDASLGRREQTKVLNRQAILDAAKRVFAQLGFDAATVRDIIRCTGLASGTFYNYFRSKEEVLVALQEDSVRRFRPILRGELEHARSLEELIRGSVRAYFEFLAEERRALGDRAALELEHPHAHTPEMQAIFQEVRGRIEEAMAMGAAPKLDAEYFTAGAIGLVQEVGARMCQRLPLQVEPAVEFCTRMLLGGAAEAARAG